MKHFTVRSAGLAVSLLVPLFLVGCGGQSPKSTLAGTPPPLKIITVHTEATRREQVWDGVVEAVNQATMSAQTAGRILALPYDVNDYVQAGAVIVRMTDVEQQATLRAAQANYNEARANYERVSRLYPQGAVSKSTLDQALARRDATTAALRAAEQQVKYTVVRAPYSGYVTKRLVHVGEEVQPGQPLIAGVSLGALRVDVQIPQSAAPEIREFHTADILMSGNGSNRLPATKMTIFPYADPETHSFSVRLELPEKTAGLYPGMTVKAAFEVGAADRLLIPVSALVQRSEVTGVYVIDGNEVSLRQLRLGHRHGDQIEVLAGLSSGEKIAIDPIAAAIYLAKQHDGETSGAAS